jgi:hypothetical protein
MRDTLEGIVSGDPLIGAPIGTIVRFAAIHLGTATSSRIPLGVSDWLVCDGALLAIFLQGSVDAKHVGSAVMIAPGLAVTALHLFDDELPHIVGGKMKLHCSSLSTDRIVWHARATAESKK